MHRLCTFLASSDRDEIHRLDDDRFDVTLDIPKDGAIRHRHASTRFQTERRNATFHPTRQHRHPIE